MWEMELFLIAKVITFYSNYGTVTPTFTDNESCECDFLGLLFAFVGSKRNNLVIAGIIMFVFESVCGMFVVA